MRLEDKITVRHGDGLVVLSHPHKDDVIMTPSEAEMEANNWTDPIRSYLIKAVSDEIH
jgi:hypothetical protein